MILKAISLWQPWASLWAAGIKIHETRSWPTKHRGLLAVHAAKRRDLSGIVLWKELWTGRNSERLRGYGPYFMRSFGSLPKGAIVGIVEIADCSRTEDCGVGISRPDYLLGNFEPGRYAWRAQKAHLFQQPIPCKGRQGFFNVEIPDAQLSEIRN